MSRIRMPDAAFARWCERVPAYTKWSFFAAIVMGLVAHLYLFTNLLPNHDAVFHLFQCDYGTASGRWFLPIVLGWDGDYNMPWLQGLLGLCCLAGTVCFTTRLLRIEKPLAIIVTAALCTAFPTVAATYTYMFTADAYFFGLFLAAFAAYAVWRMPVWGLPLGALALIFSLGIYQSYYPVAAVMMVGALLFDCLEGELHVGRILLRGVKMVAALGIGVVVYMAAARLLATMASGGLSDYMGISSMGSLSLAALPELMRQSLEAYRDYFLQNELGWNFSFIPLCVIAGWVSGVVLLATLLLRRRVGVLRGLLAFVLVGIYPLAGSLIHIMVAGAEVHDLMIYGLLYALILPLALASFAATHASEMGNLRSALQSLMSWIVIGAMALTAYSYIVTDNKAYLKMDVSFTQIEAYSNRLATEIQSVSGYSPALSVVLVGAGESDALLDVTPELSEVYITGALGMGTYRTQYSYGYLLSRFSALPNQVYLDSDMPQAVRADIGDVIEEIAESMPLYPQEGCVQIVDGYIIVRLN